MFKVTKRLKDANIAHRLLNYNGPCENIHGHTYHFEIDISSDKLNELGMVIDFSEIKTICDNWIQLHWDHAILIYEKDLELKDLIGKLSHGNKWFHSSFNTTAENMAKFLFKKFNEDFSTKGVIVSEVRIWETETSIASYKGE